MSASKKALVTVSEAYFDAMDEFVRSSDWLEDVYGRGRGSKYIETALTKSALASVGGIAEVRDSDDLPGLVAPEKLDEALSNYAKLRGEGSRIDGYIPAVRCFWEAKISKVDTLTRANSAALYDIGQWAQDLVKLCEIGRTRREDSLIYSIATIAKVAPANADDPRTWFRMFQRKLQTQLFNDLTRSLPELLEARAWRKRQLELLIGLVGLGPQYFHIRPADKWAVVSFDVRPLV